MGLDMNLNGGIDLWSVWGDHEAELKEDGFKVTEMTLELAYWRKHPNLHGYIVQTFADGVDECQKISLDYHQLGEIIDAIRADKLPETSGFFFGASPTPGDGAEYRRQKDIDIAAFEKARDWLGPPKPGRVVRENLGNGFVTSRWEDGPGAADWKQPMRGKQQITKHVYYQASW